ncbi:MAG: Cna domain protein [Bacteroidetes bacterium]|nr:Cna domain protein [Bacteroidota bacterium]
MNRMDESDDRVRRIWPQEMSLAPASLLLVALFLPFAFLGCKSDTSPTQSGDRTWTISGTTHALGSIDPLPGVIVKCAGITATSGSDGAYELRGVPEGKQTITAQKTECENYAFVVDVKSNVRHYIFMTIDGADLSGVVSNALDGPVSDAKVVVHGRTGTTDAFGRYEFSLVPHGADTLSVTHPRYIAYQAVVSLAGSAMQQNVVLKRDSTFQGTFTLAKHVDERSPNTVYFAPVDRMYLKANDPDTTVPYFKSFLQHVYINVNFPVFLADQRVSIVDASLLIRSDGPYPTTAIKTFSLQSSWYGALTYNTQPGTGSLLYSGSICDTSGAKFWQVLDTEGFNRLLTSFRTQGLLNGVVIKGASAVGSIGFYSTQAALSLRPKFTMKVRY